MVSNLLNSSLRSLIPALLCPLVNIWVSIINIKLQFLNRVVSFGLLGKIHSALSSLPVSSGHYMELDLQNYPFPSAFIDWLLRSTPRPFPLLHREEEEEGGGLLDTWRTDRKIEKPTQENSLLLLRYVSD
ncbi:BPI fold-containing family B member 3-like isoform X1 [Pezoporus flaviventris]|uniref:BPI fold-containing family B member 3-like isoform X1 n=1 Tax=Pezoporus flaviventris TaxID=889875 RepID=UPI002AAFDC21|nr:BPI fold-containing family B member 3-like isoform X1 [Pezoporus flaviventris]